jgi:hypothetical protein
MKPLFVLLFCAVFYSCESPSDHILKEFKKVNDSLVKSLNSLDKSLDKGGLIDPYTNYYNELMVLAMNHPGRLEGAKALYTATQELTVRLDSTQEILKRKDPDGEGIGIAEKVLTHTPLGDSLRKAMLEVSDRCYAALLSPDKKPALDSIFSTVKEYTTSANWNGEVFSQTPTVAAQTILVALKSRCMSAATLTMKDIDENLK